MGRAPCCDKANVKKGPWSPEEDTKLKEYIDKHGTGGNWIALPQKAGLRRCGKSCRLRWLNYLRPNIKHGEFSDDEDRIICTLFASIGSRWSIMAAQLPGRTDNDIKNHWNTKLKKKLMGLSMTYPLSPQRNLKPSLSSSLSSSFPSLSLFDQISTNAHQTPSSLSYLCSSISSPTLLNNTHINFSPSDHELVNATNSPNIILQSQDHGSYVDPRQNNYQVKENNARLMFGSGDHQQASTCSSSDGSCNNNNNNNNLNIFVNENMGNLQSSTYEGVDGNSEKINGFYGDDHQTSLDYCSLEEIKQLISTNLNFFVDENKAAAEEAKVMYY